jgi:hypothetical protein
MDVLKERAAAASRLKNRVNLITAAAPREREPNGMTQNNERQRNTNSPVISRESAPHQHPIVCKFVESDLIKVLPRGEVKPAPLHPAVGYLRNQCLRVGCA